MNQTINNVARHTKRLLERSARRSRPSYPVSTIDGQFIERKECGLNKALPVKDSHRLVLDKEFVFKRVINRPSRSKYTPHVGVKESVRKDAMALVC